MKISVITLQNVTNYGSILQTFATQCLLENLGYEVEFIDYIRDNQLKKNVRKEQLNCSSAKSLLKSLYRMYIGNALISARVKKVFTEFVKNNIHCTKKKYFSVEELRKNPPVADIYCTGSDQMWNSGWNGGIEYSYYLDFVDEKPKFAFSTSIGMDEIPKNEVETTTSLLRKYSFITVREKKAAALLESHNIMATAVLDPTLMLDGTFWKKFSQRVRKNGTPYILVYKLNSTHDSVDFLNYVKWLSSEMKLPVKVISYGITIRRVFDEYVCLPTIEEFVSLFVNAKYVVTDSFHGSAFCVNLNKQFTVIYPPKYSSRLANILSICNLQNRVCTDANARIHEEIIDYDRVNKIMNQERRRSLEAIELGLSLIEKEMHPEI